MSQQATVDMLVRLRSEGNALAEAKANLEKLQQQAAQAQGMLAKMGEALKGAFDLKQAKEAVANIGDLKEAAAGIPNIVAKLGTGDLPGAIAQFRALSGVLAGLAATPAGALGIGVAGLGAYGLNQLRAAREMREASDAMVAATNEKNLPKINELLNGEGASGALPPDVLRQLKERLKPLLAAQQDLSTDRSLGIFGSIVNPSRNKAEIERIKAASIRAVGPEADAQIRAEAAPGSNSFTKYIELYRAGLQAAILRKASELTRDAQRQAGPTPGSQEEIARAEFANRGAITREGYNAELVTGQETLQKVLRNRLATNAEQLAAINQFYERKRAIVSTESGQEEDAAEMEIGLAKANLERLQALHNADPDAMLKANARVEQAQQAQALAAKRRATADAQVEAEYQAALLEQKERAFAKEMRALEIHNAEVHRAIRDSNQIQQDEERAAVIRRTQITSSFALTKEEQDRARLKNLAAEAEGLEKIIVLRQKLADDAKAAYAKAATDPGIRPEKLNALESAASFSGDALDQAKRRRADLGVERAQIENAPDPNKWSDQWTLALTKMRAETQGFAGQVTTTFGGALEHGISGASNALAGAVLQTRGWQQALQRIPITIATEIVSAIIKMGIQWVVTQVAMLAFGKALQQSAVLTSAPFAAESAAIWATPATLATIATYGGAAAAAPEQIGIAEAATAAESIAAFAAGGVTPGTPTLAWVGEKGPEVIIPAHVTARMTSQERADAISGRGYGQGGGMGGMSIVVAPSPDQAQRISREHQDAMWVDSAKRHIHRFSR